MVKCLASRTTGAAPRTVVRLDGAVTAYLFLSTVGCLGVPTAADDSADVGVDSIATVPTDTATIGTSAGCTVESDLQSPHFLEGDTVVFTVACGGSLATDAAVFSATSLPGGSTFDPSSREFSWTTGPADGGRIDVEFSVLPADGSTTRPDVGVVTVWVADDPARSDNVPVVASAYTEEWGLPVVHVATTGEPDSADYQDASVTWYGVTYPAGIQIHGKTSSQYPKQSYALKFPESELPIAEWGVTRDHLLLITTFDDNSYVRQKFTYDLWAAMARYWGQPRLTPRAFFAVVYLDGNYHGLYVGEDRLDDEWADQLGFERDANLYKAVDDDANLALTDALGEPKTDLHAGYEKAEGEPPDDFSDLAELVLFTGSSTSEELVAGSQPWIDLNEWMDALILLQYTNAEDSYVKNVYLHHAAGEPFRYAPWDFNASWGQNWRTYRVDASFEDTGYLNNRIFWALLDNPDSTEWLWSRFDQMRTLGPLDASWQVAQLDAYFERIDPSAQRDWDRWSAEHRTYHNWVDERDENDDWTDYEGEKAYLYQWVHDRAAHYEQAHP